MQQQITRVARRTLRAGFGDLDAELEFDEYVREIKTCPHSGCGWELVTQVNRGPDTTRLRGQAETERLCLEHLASHFDPAVRSIVTS